MGATVVKPDGGGGAAGATRAAQEADVGDQRHALRRRDAGALIIFMVAAPMLTVGVPVQLPETAASALPTEQEEPLTITLTVDGRVLIQTTETADGDLIPQLRAIAASGATTSCSCAPTGRSPISAWCR
jgi:biopolymer transport protein TolR